MKTQNSDTQNRPLGYWLRAADRLMAAEFATAFESEGITRRDWRLMNAINDSAAFDRPVNEHKLGRLIQRGWVTRTDSGWTLTDSGQDAKVRLGTIVDGIRAKVADAVSPDDYATTLATLEQIARAYGWDENVKLPRRGGPARGRADRAFGRHARPFGPRRGGHRRGFGRFGGPETPEAFDDLGAHFRHQGHHRHDAARFAQSAYEHGFDAGFERGRSAR
jgi:hypothetical protein